jgi:hypothetical protein
LVLFSQSWLLQMKELDMVMVVFDHGFNRVVSLSNVNHLTHGM